MTIMKAFKIRVYPTREQEILFARTEGCCRFVYNRVLREISEAYREHGEKKSVIVMSREVTQWKKQEEMAFLAEVPSDAIAQELRDLDRAFQNFFAGRAKYPKAKKKHTGCAIRLVFDQRHAGKVRAWNGHRLVLPGFGEVRLAQPERLPAAMPKLITLRRDACGRFFVAFAVEQEIAPLPETGVSIGVDVGVKTLAVESDGTQHDGARSMKRKIRHLRRQSRALSRKVKGSNRWKRQRRRVARLHAQIADTRSDALHKASTAIVRKADVICLEDLNVSGMMANGKLARSIADQSFGEFRRQIEYKAAWHGKIVLFADRWAPTSKTCSGCGQVHDMPLRKRRMVCDCGVDLDRDHNAAINILSFCTAGNAGIDARGVGKNLSEAVFGSPEAPTLNREPKAGHDDARREREAA